MKIQSIPMTSSLIIQSPRKTELQKIYLRGFFLGGKCLKIDNGYRYSEESIQSISFCIGPTDNSRCYYKYGALLSVFREGYSPIELLNYIDSQCISNRDQLLAISQSVRHLKLDMNTSMSELAIVLLARNALLAYLGKLVLPIEFLGEHKSKEFYQITLASLGLYVMEQVSGNI